MKPGEVGTVAAVNGTGNVKHRLVDMGVVPGTAVRVMKYAPLADPVEIKVKNFELSLRISEAQMIDIEVQ
jgi:Fe2+ transport system protein A